MIPASVPVWAVGVAILLTVAVAWLISTVARAVLRGRVRLARADSIVIAMLGIAVGLVLTGWLVPSAPLWGLLAIGLSVGLSMAGMAAYAAIAAQFQRPQRATLAELVRAGESSQVEFKSTARVNLRTGRKDDRMELAIAKTACAFLNADGGSLVIGIDDAGTPLGLDADFVTLKAPDADRFELWLRDFLISRLGQSAASMVEVDFDRLPGPDGDALACRLICQPSPRPVYLRQGRNVPPELWVRIGNSSRQLSVDDASEYVMHRWPLSLGSSIAAQVRAAMRFQER